MLLIDAVYIHESGGKSLLDYLLESLEARGILFYLLLDKRAEGKINIPGTCIQHWHASPSESGRKNFYRTIPTGVTTVFCFANVPPPVKPAGKRVFIFMQNTLLLSPLGEKNLYSFREKIRFFFKKAYIRYRNKKEYFWVVQTPSMRKKAVAALTLEEANIFIIPFYREPSLSPTEDVHDPLKFIYVADGVKHKNHLALFKAWEILASEYLFFPELHLTIPERYERLIDTFGKINRKGAKIINHEVVYSDQLEALYRQSGFLIFPSVAESFGLPLIEATCHGCGVMAADLPYVHDIAGNVLFFNPYDPDMIASVIFKRVHGPYQSPYLKIKNHIKQLIELLQIQ